MKVINLWSAETRIGPLCFQAGCRRRRLNLALVFFVVVLCCCRFLLIGECVLCCVRFFPYQAKRLAWGTSLKWPILCGVGCKTLTQSIIQYCTQYLHKWHRSGKFWACDNADIDEIYGCQAYHNFRAINCGRYKCQVLTSSYATWFTAGGAIRIAHYDVIDDVITRKL